MNTTLTRKLSSIALVAAAFTGAGAVTGAPAANASSNVYAPSFDCNTSSVSPPYSTSVGTWNTFYISTNNRASWQTITNYTANLSQWKLVGNQWQSSDWSGASTYINFSYPQVAIAYVHTWNYISGKWYDRGWTYLGTCQGWAF